MTEEKLFCPICGPIDTINLQIWWYGTISMKICESCTVSEIKTIDDLIEYFIQGAKLGSFSAKEDICATYMDAALAATRLKMDMENTE